MTGPITSEIVATFLFQVYSINSVLNIKLVFQMYAINDLWEVICDCVQNIAF